MLLELKGRTTTSRTSFPDALKVATGDDCTVEELVPRVILEIRDFDSCTSEDEVNQALKRDLQDYNLTPGNGGWPLLQWRYLPRTE